jgi:SulP family sulfate permease
MPDENKSLWGRLPFLTSLHGYQAAWLSSDLVAGLTLVAIAVPEQMATARLVGVSPGIGLYVFVAAAITFAVLGRSPQLSSGADSTIAPIIAAGVGAIALAGTVQYDGLVSLLAVFVGVVVMAIGLLRMGWIAQLLSTPVITGILAGIAVEIIVRQLPAILGLTGGGTTTIGKLQAVYEQLHLANGWSAAIAVAVFLIIFGAHHVNERLPGALAGVVLSIAFVALFHLQGHGVQVIGAIHSGLPHWSLPHGSLMAAKELIAPALTIAFVIVAQTAATVRGLGASGPTAGTFNQDLTAIGAGSLLSAAVGGFAVDSSPPRTGIVTAAGGKSQLASLLAAAVVLVIVLFAGGSLTDLPKAALGAILVFVATRLFRVKVMIEIWHFSRIELSLAVATGLVVILVGIEQGAIAAVVVSLADRTRRSARPYTGVLGREVGTDHWIPADVGRPTIEVPGVVVSILYGPLWYGNADYVADHIRQEVTGTPGTKALVIDADAIPDVDYTGALRLTALIEDLKSDNVTTAIARSSHALHHELELAGIIRSLGADHFFVSVDDAVAALVETPAAGGS